MKVYEIQTEKDNWKQHKFAVHSDEWSEEDYKEVAMSIAKKIYANKDGEIQGYTISEIIEKSKEETEKKLVYDYVREPE
jgi:hypothetical protein